MSVRLFSTFALACGLLLVLAPRGAAQCTVSGAIEAPIARLHGELSLARLPLPSVEVVWPPRTDGTTSARMRSPFDAPIVLEQIPFRLRPDARLPAAFFELRGSISSAVAVEWDGREASLRFGSLRVHRAPRCRELELGRAARPFVSAVSNSIGGFRVEAPIVLRERPGGGARLRVSPAGGPLELDIVERRAGWLRLAHRFGEDGLLHGWVPADPARETAYRSGAGGFEARGTWSDGHLDWVDGCYVGPAYLRIGAPVFVHRDDVEAWGTVTDSSDLQIRDCGGTRVEIVGAMDRVASFGWIDALDLTRAGALRCEGGLVLLQSPVTGRIVVAEDLPPLLRGDEILRVGTHRVVDIFETVMDIPPSWVCDGWEDGQLLRVLRGGQPLALTHRVP